ncbi:hypothetical protein ABE527_14715 [Brucella sp. TWI432]
MVDFLEFIGERAGIRTLDLLIKSGNRANNHELNEHHLINQNIDK